MESKAIIPDASSIINAIDSVAKKEDYELFLAFRKKEQEKPGIGWSLLSQIFNFHLMAEKTEPFGPVLSGDGWNTGVPADLSGSELDALQSVLYTVTDPAFQSRAGDILWLRRKDHNVARIAVTAYINAGLAVEDTQNWQACMERYERGLRLARQIDPKGKLPNTVLAHLAARVRHHNGDDPMYFTCKSLELLAEFRFGDFPVLAEIAGRVAANSCAHNDFLRAKDYFDVQAKLWKLAKNNEAEEASRVTFAETHVQEAELREAKGYYIDAPSFWENAVLAFRERPSLRARIPELKRRLANAGRKAIGATTSSVFKIDNERISKEAEVVEATFKGLLLDDALCYLAAYEDPIDPVSIRKHTLQEIENGAFYAEIPVVYCDEIGRKVSRRPSISSSDSKKREAALEGLIEKKASIVRNLTVAGSFAPAIRTILSEHDVTEKEIEGLIADSAFIPEGRLSLFVKAIADGFRWDFSTALHIFVPQAENGLRLIIEQSGEIPRSMNHDGIEQVLLIDRVLGNERLKGALGVAFTFDLQSLLSGRKAPNLRNKIAHGLVSSESLNSSDGIYLWWLLFRLVVFPTSIMAAFRERHAVAQNTEKPPGS